MKEQASAQHFQLPPPPKQRNNFYLTPYVNFFRESLASKLIPGILGSDYENT
jgi:hypothetical protein